jgi:triacylglycerol lipase
MTTRPLVDPEIAPLIDLIPSRSLTLDNLAQARIDSETRFAALPEGPVEGVARDAGGVGVLVFTPPGDATLRSGILHIHGGGMVIGTAHGSRRWPSVAAALLGAVVVSVDYRLAPEAPFPAPQEDCYAALAWFAANAAELGVDPARIAVMGESAGGGLAASVALMARDRGGPAVCAQLLTYPMLDHRTGGPDDVWRNPAVGEFMWTRELNQFGWRCLQGDYALDDARLGWFSPARAADLSRLPPALLLTGSLDLFFDENLDFARRLVAAGVPCELHSYRGAIHAFNAVPGAKIAQAYLRDFADGAQRFLAA